MKPMYISFILVHSKWALSNQSIITNIHFDKFWSYFIMNKLQFYSYAISSQINKWLITNIFLTNFSSKIKLYVNLIAILIKYKYILSMETKILSWFCL